jgi:hypothetical protein
LGIKGLVVVVVETSTPSGIEIQVVLEIGVISRRNKSFSKRFQILDVFAPPPTHPALEFLIRSLPRHGKNNAHSKHLCTREEKTARYSHPTLPTVANFSPTQKMCLWGIELVAFTLRFGKGNRSDSKS